MREIIVTVKDKDGDILGEVEMTWDDKRFPASFLELTPRKWGVDLPKIHPCQGAIFIDEKH